MIKKNFTNNVIKPISVVLVVVLFVYIIPWLVLSNGCSILSGSAKPADPYITYGEFPFEITYRIGEKTVTEKGTYVCEFQRVKYSIDLGYYYDWKGYIKETGESGIYITEDDERTIYCSVGISEDYIYHYKDKVDAEPYFYADYKESNQVYFFKAEDVKEQFDLEMIDYKYGEPIQ